MSDIKTNRFNEVAAACKKAITWFDGVDDPKIINERQAIEDSLCEIINDSKAAYAVLPRKTTLGLFGASQAGKSYLVSSLTADGDKDLVANLDDHMISFSKHLNPEHGGQSQESSGVVARFTTEKEETPKGFPFPIKLFTEIDLVKILVNSFYKDLDLKIEDFLTVHDRFFKDNAQINQFFDAVLKEHPLKEGDTCYVHENDIYSLAQYTKRSGQGVLADTDSLKECVFWNRARKAIDKLSFEGRIKVYSKIWGDSAEFDALFKVIGGQLNLLKGATTAYAPLDVCISEIREDGTLVKKDCGILDIAVISQLFENHTVVVNTNDMIKIALDKEGKSLVEIPFPVLTFACKEVAFPIPENSKAKNFDVLDFPGARTRKKESPVEFNDSLSEFLRRGKVAYLFESYAEKHEVDLLLWCISVEGQQEVNEPQIDPITEWVKNNVGRTPEEREAFPFKVKPLIGAFTRFDRILRYALDKPLSERKETFPGISKSLDGSLQHFRKDWFLKWNTRDPFDQFFCVRKPNIKTVTDQLYKFDESNRETETLANDEISIQFDNYKKYIKEAPEAQFVYDEKKDGSLQQTFEAVLKPNDGGVSYLIGFLDQNFKNYRASKDKFEDSLNNRISALLDKISTFATIESIKMVKQKKENCKKLIKELMQCERLAGTIADLRHYLELDEDKAVDDYIKNNPEDGISDNAYRFANALSRMYRDNLESIKTGDYFDELFEKLNYYWDPKKQNSIVGEEQQKAHSFFFDESTGKIISNSNDLKTKFRTLLSNYVDDLDRAYDALNVEQAIVDKLKEYESQKISKSKIAVGQAERGINIISDFNTYLTVGSIGYDIDRITITKNGKKPQVEDRPLFKENVSCVSIDNLNTDDADNKNFKMYLLPDITPDIEENFEEHYYSDYFSVYLDLVVSKLDLAKAKYQITDKQNKILCEIIESIETAKENSDKAE